MAGVLLLDNERLRMLAELIYRREVNAMSSIQFNSEAELAQYLRDCRTSYETVLALLDAAAAELALHQRNDSPKGSIAQDIFEYIKYGCNNALQMVRNYTLRIDYLTKIKVHSNDLILRLQELDIENVTNVQVVAKEAALYRNAMMEYARKHLDPTSRWFSRRLKEEGLSFEDLVKRYQARLGFEGPFQNLEDAEKLQVYEEIIEASGRGRVIVNNISTALGVTGIAVLLFISAMMVWDIFTSEHHFEAATRDAMQAVAAVGGAMLGEVVAAALATTSTIVIAPLIVTGSGIILGIAGGFILGAFAGWLVNLIFRSGGDTSTLSTDGLRCYVAPMPDGVALAYQISHLNN